MRPTLLFHGETLAPDVFEQRWQRSAGALAAAGIGDGDVVALLMRNSPEALELMIAVRHLGAQWCPINWHSKDAEVAYILGNSGAKLLVADAALLAALPALDAQGVPLHTIRGSQPGVPAWEALRDAAEPMPEPAAAPRGAARCSTPRAPRAGPRASCAGRWPRNSCRPPPRCAARPTA